ncbi:MAG: hypothetical protein Q9190_007969 [Brigantiaea leucoxantha]
MTELQEPSTPPKVKRRKNADLDYRKAYLDTRHTADMERQLRGPKLEPASVVAVIRHQLEERHDLQRIRCSTGQQLSGEEVDRQRLEAVSLMIRLCGRREVQQHRRRANRPKTPPWCKDETMTDVFEDPVFPDGSGVPDPFPLECGKRDSASSASAMRPWSTSVAPSPFSTRSKMMDHVESHLRNMSLAHGIACPHPQCRVYGTVLDDVVHFKNHVHVVHGIKLRS